MGVFHVFEAHIHQPYEWLYVNRKWVVPVLYL